MSSRDSRDSSSPPPSPEVRDAPPIHDEEAMIRARKCTFMTSLLMVACYMTAFATFSAAFRRPTTTTTATPPPTITPPPTDTSSSSTTTTRNRKRVRVTPNRNRKRVRVSLNRNRSTHLTLTVKSKPQPQPQPQPEFVNHTTPLLVVFLASIFLWSTFFKALVMLVTYHVFVKMFFPTIRHPTLVGLSEGLSEMRKYWKVVVTLTVVVLVGFATKKYFWG